MSRTSVPFDLPLTGIIDERYSIEREIGRGGMATVYLARDLRQGNRVALKVLSSDFASVVSGERFSREIRITAGLQHPNILPVFDSGTVDGHPYYVMPFVDGPTLAGRIRKEGPLPIDQALEIAAEVADALQHAHAQGIVHRDIKPSNILLAHGHAVVADFGVARAIETVTDQDLTRTGIAVGTAAYMSPEQAAGENVDGRSDIYSLGCVLYEMLAGNPPFAAENARALMAKHWMDEAPSLRAARPSVRASIDALVRKAMAKKRSDRFATAGELEDAIKSVSTEERLAAIGFTPPDDQPSFAPGAGTRATPVESAAFPDESEAPKPAITRRWGVLRSAALVFGIAVLTAGGWYFTRSHGSGLDPNRVIVYPLVVPDDFKGSRNVGEDIGTMIGTALDGIGSLRWVDGWPLLAPSVRQDIRTLSGADARAIARSKRAAWYLSGRIVARGDSSEVFVELNDVDGDSTVARGRASGLTSDAWRTGLRAVNSILPHLIPPGTKTDSWLAEWTDRDPAAIASFLLAESSFRRTHLSEALDRYRDALAADSTFALAAIRGAQAAAWNHEPEEAQSLLEAALRQPLTERYSHFARGYEAYLEGAADSAAAELRRSVAIDPDNSAAWMQLGEVYTHLLPVSGNVDSLARFAFDEAHRIDPAARNLLLHSIEIRLRDGDVKSAAPLVAEFMAGDPDSVLAEQVKVMYDCVRSGPGSVDWTREAKVHPLAVLASSNTLKGGGRQLGCVSRGYAALMRSDTSLAAAGRTWSATLGTASLYLIDNKTAAAEALVDSSMAKNRGGGSLYLMAGLVYPALLGRAKEVAAHDEQSYGPGYANPPTQARLWQLGLLESLHGRRDVARQIEQRLSARAAETHLASDARLAKSLAAFNALSRGDTAAAMVLFEHLVAAPVPGSEIVWDMAGPRGIERLTLARLLVAKGDYRKAIDIANVFDASWPSIYLLYVPTSLQLRAEAAQSLSDHALAARYRNRLAAIRGELAVAGK